MICVTKAITYFIRFLWKKLKVLNCSCSDLHYKVDDEANWLTNYYVKGLREQLLIIDKKKEITRLIK